MTVVQVTRVARASRGGPAGEMLKLLLPTGQSKSGNIKLKLNLKVGGGWEGEMELNVTVTDERGHKQRGDGGMAKKRRAAPQWRGRRRGAHCAAAAIVSVRRGGSGSSQ